MPPQPGGPAAVSGQAMRNGNGKERKDNRKAKRVKRDEQMRENEKLNPRLHLHIHLLLTRILQVSNLIIVLIERLARLFQFSLHA